MKLRSCRVRYEVKLKSFGFLSRDAASRKIKHDGIDQIMFIRINRHVQVATNKIFVMKGRYGTTPIPTIRPLLKLPACRNVFILGVRKSSCTQKRHRFVRFAKKGRCHHRFCFSIFPLPYSFLRSSAIAGSKIPPVSTNRIHVGSGNVTYLKRHLTRSRPIHTARG